MMKNLKGMRWFLTGGSVGLVLLTLAFGGVAAKAQAPDGPVHRAARLSYLQGSVSVEHMDNTGSDPGLLNMPLAAGVRVATGEDGQAEIEFEDGSLVRLTPNSALSLNVLSVDGAGNFQTQLGLVHGLIYAELRAAEKFTYSVDANGDVILPVTNTTVRVTLDEPPAVISVLDGTIHVEHSDGPDGAGYQSDVRSGETLTRDREDGSRYFLTQEIAPDSWDQWNESRDQAAADEAANQTAARDEYAGTQGYGWSDLDANGTWYNVPGQGMVWQPNVAADAGFDPYGYGSWVYYPGTGYVWASGYGWGWTPYRCGNWSYWSGFGWGWLPGSGCGLGGWGFGGGGYVINVIRPPQTYRFPLRPVRGVGPPRPIHIGRPARPGDPGWAGGPGFRGPRSIAGETAQPLRPRGGGYTSRGGSAVGSSLRRDFPVDRESHKPVLGVTTPPAGRPGRPGWTPGSSPGAITRGPSGGSRPANPTANPPTHSPADSQTGNGGSTVRRGPMRPPPPAQGADPAAGERPSRGWGNRPDRSSPQTSPQTPAQPSGGTPPAESSRPVQPPPAARPVAPSEPTTPRPAVPPQSTPRPNVPPPPPRESEPRPNVPQQPRESESRPYTPQQPREAAPRPMPPQPGPRSVPQPSLRPERSAPAPAPQNPPK